MKCPRCPGTLGSVRTEESVSVDFCRECGGIWLDEGELAQLLNQEGAAPTIPARSASEDGLRCPGCDDTKLSQLEHPPGSGIMLDGCASCNGVWLDRGEVGKLQALKRSANAQVYFSKVCSSAPSAAAASKNTARSGDKRDLLIPILEVETSKEGRGLQLGWVLASAIIICAALGLVAVITEAIWVADSISDTSTEGYHLWVTSCAAISFLLGGFLVGWRSPGHTIWEPALAALPASLAFGGLFSEYFPTQDLALLTGLGVILALVGGLAGERFQAS